MVYGGAGKIMKKSGMFIIIALLVLGFCAIAQALTINKVTLENGEIVEVRNSSKGVVKYLFPDGITVKVSKNIFGETNFLFSDRGSVKLHENEFGEIVYIFPSKDHGERLKMISKIQSLDKDVHKIDGKAHNF
jgi:hypothetical protein